MKFVFISRAKKLKSKKKKTDHTQHVASHPPPISEMSVIVPHFCYVIHQTRHLQPPNQILFLLHFLFVCLLFDSVSVCFHVIKTFLM